MPMASMEIRIADMPDVLNRLMREMTTILQTAAVDESPEVQAFAARVSAAFEVGLASLHDDASDGAIGD